MSDTLYHGYRLLTCDGSNVNISRDSSDDRSFIYEGETGYNAIHINALYDIINQTYCDCLVQGKKKLYEHAALISMIDRYADSVLAFVMADRGYESVNAFAHLICKNMKFDTYIKTTLTRRHTKKTLGDPNIYTILQPVTNFDFLNESGS